MHDAGLTFTLGALGGLICTGVGGVYSWLVYGSPELYEHPPAIVVTTVLCVLVGVKVDSVITWLLSPPPDFPPPRRRRR